MKLLAKGSAMLSIVLAFQLSFYAILLLLLLDAERLIDRGDNDRAIHKEIAAFSHSLTNTVLLSATFVFMRSRELFKRAETAVESSSRHIRKIQSLPGLTPEDNFSAQSIAQNFSRLRDALNESVNPAEGQLSLPLLQQSKQLSSKLLPLMGEIQSESVAIVRRHDKIAISVTELSSRRLITGLVIGGTAGTTLFMILMYVAFTKYIVGRLEHLMRLIEARANNRELQEPLIGKDEFSILDAQFRNLSHSLSETAKREKDILESMPVALFVCTADWLIETVNETACKLLQYTADELVNTSLTRICDQQWLSERSVDLINRCTVQDRHAEMIDVELSTSQFLQQGTSKNLVCLIDAREQVEVERLKQHFVAMVSHDIRTPIAALKVFLSVVDEDVYGEISDQGRQSVQQSRASADSLLRMTESLLDLARTEQNTIVIERSACSINGLIVNALDSIASDIRARGVQLTASNTAQNDTILIDEVKVLRALIGLLKSLLPEDEAASVTSIDVIAGISNQSFTVTMNRHESDTREQVHESNSRLRQQLPEAAASGGGTRIEHVRLTEEDGEFLISRLLVEALGGSITLQDGAQAVRCIKVCLPVDQIMSGD